MRMQFPEIVRRADQPLTMKRFGRVMEFTIPALGDYKGRGARGLMS